MVPESLVVSVPKTKLKSDTAKDQCEQHHRDRKIDRRNDDREGQRESGEEPEAAQNQPGLVAVPDRPDRVHDDVAGAGIWRQAMEHAEAEIETLDQAADDDSRPEDQSPDRAKVEDLVHAASTFARSMACASLR